MTDGFNYARHELSKLDDGADYFGIVVDSAYYDSGKITGATRRMSLNKEQKDQIADLLISFKL